MSRLASFYYLLNRTRFATTEILTIKKISNFTANVNYLKNSSSTTTNSTNSIICPGKAKMYAAIKRFGNETTLISSTPTKFLRNISLSNPIRTQIIESKNLYESKIHKCCALEEEAVKMVDVTKSPVLQQINAKPAPKLLEKDEFDEFNAVFPELVNFLTEMPEFRDMPETNRWVKRVLQYNVPFGKRNRGLAVALAYRYFTNELHEDNIKLSYVLGWTVEFLQAFFLIADDIMDGSETRRGRPCWYKVDNMGPAAVNDSILVENSIFMILKKYFKGTEYYIDLMEIMHEALYKTAYGQSLDTRTGLGRDMQTYTMDRYNGIVKYKTSYYSFHLPVALAMAMAGVKDVESKRQVEKVTLEIGHFFQVQDDYLDCYGDEEITGKIGTDIQDCKCSWLFVKALEKATPAQKDILFANYGQDEKEKIAKVKEIYGELKMLEIYNDFEEQTYKLITNHIQQMSSKLPKRLFVEMLAKIYRRTC